MRSQPDRTLRLSRTITDLAGSEAITHAHLAEALQYRPKLDITKKWRAPIRNWSLILNQLAIHFEGRRPLWFHPIIYTQFWTQPLVLTYAFKIPSG